MKDYISNITDKMFRKKLTRIYLEYFNTDNESNDLKKATTNHDYFKELDKLILKEFKKICNNKEDYQRELNVINSYILALNKTPNINLFQIISYIIPILVCMGSLMGVLYTSQISITTTILNHKAATNSQETIDNVLKALDNFSIEMGSLFQNLVKDILAIVFVLFLTIYLYDNYFNNKNKMKSIFYNNCKDVLHNKINESK